MNKVHHLVIGHINGWAPKDAAGIPTRKQIDRKELVKIAESNGISVSTFRSRLSYGWDPIKAATTPAKSKIKILVKRCR